MENSRHIVFPGLYRTIERHQRALALAKKAVELDPLDSRAQLCLAWAYSMAGQFDLSEATFRQASDLNEDDPWTTTSTALGLAYAGRLEEATELADRALERAPYPSPMHWCYLSTVRFLAGDLNAAVDAAERAGDSVEYFSGWRTATFVHAGVLSEAKAEGRRFLDVMRQNWHGGAEPSDEAIARWFVHCFPLRHRKTLAMLSEALRKAGVPVPRSATA